MRHKIVRADGETVITEFKSFRYVEQVNDESNLRYGTIISSFIEAEVYGSPSSAVQEGEVLTYYQVFDTDNSFNPLPEGQTNELKIGVFTARVTLPQRNTYRFTAFDNISKLDVDFSSVLKANERNFPMSVAALTTLVANTANVTIELGNCPLHYLGNDVKVQFFYADGITCRQIISYIVEVSGSNIYCLPNGTIVAQGYVSDRSLTIPLPDFWWQDNYHYIICPTDTVTYTGTDSVGNPITLIPVYYKQDGFEKANYTCETLDTFSVKKTSGEEVWGMIGQNPYDIYEINSNPIVDHITLSDMIDWDDIMMVVDGEVEDQTLKGIVPFTIHLFPFRNPFRAGEFLPYIQGSDGVRFRSLIMKMEVTDSEAVLYCYGNEKWHVSSQLTRTSDEMNVAIMGSTVSKSGDTMTGDLNIDRKVVTNGAGRLRLIGNRKAKAGTDDAGTSNRPFGGIYIYDSSTDGNGPNDEYNVFYNECTLHENDNRVYASYVVRRLLTNGTAANNGFYIGVNTDGSSHVSFAGGGKKAWVSALLLPSEVSVTIPSTLPTGISEIEYIHVIRSGYIVHVMGTVTRNTTSVTNWNTLASGLPGPMVINSKPIYQSVPPVQTSTVNTNLFLRITTSGVLQFAYGGAASSTAVFRFAFSYVADAL